MELDLVQERLYGFCVESDEIESIYDQKRHKIHEAALRELLSYDRISVKELSGFVARIEPSAFLRKKPDHRVMIGGHEAPPPKESLPRLEKLLESVNANRIHPWDAHVEYEHIHPYIDGNGRSGRALWLWMMIRFHEYDLSHKFLQRFYYQTLSRKHDGNFI